MEKILPVSLWQSLRPEQQESWRKRIYAALQELRPQIGKQNHRIQRMSHVFSLMQGLSLFGALHWNVRQEAQTRKAGPVAMTAPPAVVLRLNPWNASGDTNVRIYVDLRGVHMVVVDGRYGSGLKRSFLYRAEVDNASKEGCDRLLRWGARPPILQLAVLVLDPAKPAAGRVEQLITLHGAQVLDIAYAVHRAMGEGRAASSEAAGVDAGAAPGGEGQGHADKAAAAHADRRSLRRSLERRPSFRSSVLVR
eukprot:gnl/TRDRNA2_/TRDRNA2_156010_c0_seq1.p1 gnl/TRDRNA2_/TRDRNA2_156010_c0~~gnl/TRDRNA2_/TRDRNA2_156010_c0_seq1.p1  ORF type:complete len:268 (-),score=36.86 gnl/TRDRNA2_/TRDRNA2_156010_c0_seq1:65-817(-)